RGGQGCKIPQTVKQIQGINSATIEVTNFAYNVSTNKAALWYETFPTTNDYWIDGMSVECTDLGVFHGYGTGRGFNSCTQLTNCTGSGTSDDEGQGFNSCTQLTNCTGTGITTVGLDGGYGFNSCAYLNGCKQGEKQSTTGFLGGTNTKVDTATVVAI
ncbi:MAG: hypothetical protein RSA20_09205, partial [Oscillospiraceae bacterium]